jgi:hypothetical protein
MPSSGFEVWPSLGCSGAVCNTKSRRAESSHPMRPAGWTDSGAQMRQGERID